MKRKIPIGGILTILVLTIISCTLSAQTYIGIDVSHHQGKIQWEEVAKEKIDFVYIKATEGATYIDPCFHYNIKGATDAGLLVGAYHYFRMTSGATEQFHNFKKALKGYNISLVPMIDVETSDGKSVKELQDSLNVFIRLLKEEYGCPPMIYGTQRSYNTYCAPRYNNYHLYIGRYGPNKPVIMGTGTYTIWQYTEKASVRGIPKPVDMCRFHPKYTIANIRRKIITTNINTN
jgi:lysozyme